MFTSNDVSGTAPTSGAGDQSPSIGHSCFAGPGSKAVLTAQVGSSSRLCGAERLEVRW